MARVPARVLTRVLTLLWERKPGERSGEASVVGLERGKVGVVVQRTRPRRAHRLQRGLDGFSAEATRSQEATLAGHFCRAGGRPVEAALQHLAGTLYLRLFKCRARTRIEPDPVLAQFAFDAAVAEPGFTLMQPAGSETRVAEQPLLLQFVQHGFDEAIEIRA